MRVNKAEIIDESARVRPGVDAFLAAKLDPPKVRPRWIARDELVRRLERGTRECALTLLAAPAGYGKTTLVAQWLEVATQRVAWVALDPADNDPARMWTHIVTALARVGCAFGDDPAHLVAAGDPQLRDGLLPIVINAMADLGEPVVLVLDDYHFVRADACHEQIDFLIEHSPSTAALVIMTRADPALRLGRLRAATQLAEIRMDRLRFDMAETAALLASEDVHLSGTVIPELLQRTEGWPAGLYLATLSLAGRDEPDAFVHEFSGDNRYIGDYLTEEVLTRQPPEVRDFIISVSILERFSASLCDFVLETDRSGRILAELERSNLFLVPLDARRRWFRFHHLFAAVARAELDTEPARARALHGRAVDWFAAHGYVDEGIGHAIASGSPARAARLVQANWVDYVGAGRTATVDRWLRTLRTTDGPPDAGTLVTQAWIALLRGDEVGLKKLMAELAELPDVGALPDGTRSVQSALALLEGMTGHGGVAQLLSAARRAAELESDPRSPWYAAANFGLGHARYAVGDLDGALEVLPRAAYSETTFPIIRVFALGVMSMVAREHRKSELSRRCALEAMAVVDEASLRPIPQASFAFTALGESEVEAGNLTEGMAILEEGLVLRRKVSGINPWPTIHHLLAMGRALTVVGDLRRAEHLLDEAGRLMSVFPGELGAMRDRLSLAHAVLRRHAGPDKTWEPLTPRELEILRHLQGPKSLSGLAAELFVSPNTVKTHAQAVYRKLGATTRSEAVQIARRRSLI